jgi:hypothetical protein
MTNVVALRPEPSAFQIAWSEAPTLMRTRSSTKDAAKAWRDAAKEAGGPEALLGAFRRYLAEDPDYRRFRMGASAAGPPGFHRWLKWGRWEAWLVTANASPSELCNGPGRDQDNPIRTALVQALGEGFVRSYIDPFPIVDGVLIVPEGKLTARARLLENRDKLRAAGLVSMRKPDA